MSTPMSNKYRPSLFKKTAKSFSLEFISINITELSLISDKVGCQPGHSTQLELMYLIKISYNALDEGRDLTSIYFDISWYFEKIWHAGLLAKCEKEFGWLTGSLLTWLRSYVTNRRQTVDTNNSISPTLTLNHGVPQGFVLGPLLTILNLKWSYNSCSVLSRS